MLNQYRWPIRNSGLMLFKALLTRLNRGAAVTSTRSMGGKYQSNLFYRKYRKMADLVATLLQPSSLGFSVNELGLAEAKESQAKNTQRIFAALELLQTFGLPDEPRAKVTDLIWHHVINPSWSIREKAAATFCSVLTRKELEDLEKRLLRSDWASDNELHGRVLCLRILESRNRVSDKYSTRPAYNTDFLSEALDEASSSNEPTDKYKMKEALWIRWLVVVAGDFHVSALFIRSTLTSCSPSSRL